MADSEEKVQQGVVPDWSRGLPLMAGDWFMGLYQPTPETTEYWKGVGRGELLLKWCGECGKAYHPRRIVCTACGSTGLTWKRSTGRGTVYSYSDVHRAPGEEFKQSAPYTIGLVELEEGVHLFTRFIPEGGAAIEIGTPVEVDFRVLELGQLLPVFLARGSAGGTEAR